MPDNLSDKPAVSVNENDDGCQKENPLPYQPQQNIEQTTLVTGKDALRKVRFSSDLDQVHVVDSSEFVNDFSPTMVKGLTRMAVLQILFLGRREDVLDRMKNAVLEAAYEKAFQRTPPLVKGKNMYMERTLLYEMNLRLDEAYRGKPK
eukprot:scaffold1000_cov166-Amphora_coffeaeformis.AAC.8